MKKSFFVVFFMFFALVTWAQVLIENNTGYNISVSNKKGGQEITLLVGGDSKTVDWFDSNPGSAPVYIKYLKNGTIESTGRITVNINDRKIILKKDDLDRQSEPEQSGDLLNFSNSGAEQEENPTDIMRDSISITPVNSSSHRLVFLDGPFRGVSLKGNARSSYSALVKPGLMQCALLFDKDKEDSSTGRNYAQAVFSKIITETDSALTIREADLMFSGSENKKMRLKSNFPHKFVITGGPFSGAAISPGKYWTGTVQVAYGFNSASVQYFDPRTGDKIQANLELIITPNDKVIEIGPANIKGGRKVK